MKIDKKPLELTEVVFRDGSQSLLATRLKLDDILPIAEKVDDIGFTQLSHGEEQLLMPAFDFLQRIPGRE